MQVIKDQVNAYLFSAQTLAKESCSSSQSKPSARAASVGACLCLKQAWECWLIELAGYLSAEPFGLEGQSDALVAKYPDYQYLATLKRQDGSWYSELLLYCADALVSYDRGSGQSVEPSSERLISAVVLDAEPKAMSLLEVVQAAKSYIQQIRAQQTEW